MAMNKIGVYVEDQNGNEYGPYRMTYAHRVQTEKTCKARGIDLAGVEGDLVSAWITSRAQQDSPFYGLSRDDWEAVVLDATVQRLGPEDEADELDPTQPAQ